MPFRVNLMWKILAFGTNYALFYVCENKGVYLHYIAGWSSW
jgi:hypothetical protein